MDEVQSMLHRLDAEMAPTSTAELPVAATEKRTRLVFLYSDEDETKEASAAPTAKSCVVTETATSTALHVSDEELARMRREAEEMVRSASGTDHMPALPVRRDDMLGGFVRDILPTPLAYPACGEMSEEGAGVGSSPREAGLGADGMRVCAVEADTLPTPPTAGSQYRARHQRATRTYLLPSELDSTLPRLKRFRDEEDDGSEVPVELGALQPAIVEDGVVRAVQSAGYRLTVNEADLLQETANAEADEVVGMVDGKAAEEALGDDGDNAVVGTDMHEVAVDDAVGGDDWLDDEEEEDEEEEALDEMLVAAVVERLVACCEADDLDQTIAPAAQRFTSVAKPLLQRLQASDMTLAEFGHQVDRDLRRFLRVYRAVYRPKDEPIVIDGVVMDM